MIMEIRVILNHTFNLTVQSCLVLSSSPIFQAHPWFRCIQWDMLYETEAAYKPTVNGDLDTQNFEKFPDVSFNIPFQHFCAFFYFSSSHSPSCAFILVYIYERKILRKTLFLCSWNVHRPQDQWWDHGGR